MTIKTGRSRRAVALLVACLLSPAPAYAAASSPAGLTPEEAKRREEYRQAIAALPTAASLQKSPLATASLDALLPGAGTLYLTGDGGAAFNTTFSVLATDALVLGAGWWYAGTLTGSQAQNFGTMTIPLGAGVALAHLFVGGAGGALKASKQNAEVPVKLEAAAKELRAKLAVLDRIERDRAEFEQGRRQGALNLGRRYQQEGKYAEAVQALASSDWAGEPEFRALHDEVAAQWKA